MNAWLFLFIVAAVGRAEIIDRIAVVVGNSVITESEIVREIRLTAFLNQEPLDFSVASKRKTAERLVEQRLIQIENDASLYPPPPADAVEQALAQVKAKTSNPKGYQDELTRTGVSEEELKAHLRRQLATLRFLDLRFRPGIQIGDAEIGAYFEERLLPDLKKARPDATFSVSDYRTQIEEALIAERVDKASDTWLKEARDHARIEFRASVFAPDSVAQETPK